MRERLVDDGLVDQLAAQTGLSADLVRAMVTPDPAVEALRRYQAQKRERQMMVADHVS